MAPKARLDQLEHKAPRVNREAPVALEATELWDRPALMEQMDRLVQQVRLEKSDLQDQLVLTELWVRQAPRDPTALRGHKAFLAPLATLATTDQRDQPASRAQLDPKDQRALLARLDHKVPMGPTDRLAALAIQGPPAYLVQPGMKAQQV